MKPLFFTIDESKRENLINESIKEFSKHYYFEASLNQIIKNANISKGGLFKYIESKQDLYLYLFEKEITKLVAYQASSISKSTDFFNRVRDIAEKSLGFYQLNPNVYQFILKALTDQSASVHQKVVEIRNSTIKRYQQNLLEGVDYTQYKFSKDDLLNIFSFITSGIDSFIIKGNHSITDILKMLDLVINALQFGVRM